MLTTSPHFPCQKGFQSIDEGGPNSAGEVGGRISDLEAWEKMKICQPEQEEASVAKMTTRAKTWRI